ncbi:MAG: hypothetical protein C0511_03035 [Hyphomicrobium sp.]|nr:hypothetical protein [Hyphomicrobium sp.]PPD28289.1 MAG: hypothetical protein CTY20_10605 [Hyphomicrobium sp.]
MNNQEGSQPLPQMQAEIAELSGRIAEVDDPRDGYVMVRDRIQQYRAAGWAIPEDLAQIEKNLRTDCMLASRGG